MFRQRLGDRVGEIVRRLVADITVGIGRSTPRKRASGTVARSNPGTRASFSSRDSSISRKTRSFNWLASYHDRCSDVFASRPVPMKTSPEARLSRDTAEFIFRVELVQEGVDIIGVIRF
jgi:hypothetical protein